MYTDYWGLSKSPFDNVPDPSMYFKMHSSVESTVAELLFAIEEGNECLAVLVGEVGLGKTMALRVTLDALNMEKYRIAFVTNPDLTFPQLLREILGQLKGETCTIRGKEVLLEEFNRILFHTADEDKKVLIFIDEGNVLKGPQLESLRLLTNMQDDDRNLFTLILAGQPNLGKMLQDKRRANIMQRVGVLCALEPLTTVDLVRDYVDHRLERAGCMRKVFTDEAFTALWERSGGIPRLINKLCKLSLKAGETNELTEIGPVTVLDIAKRFEWAAPAKKKRSRRKAPAIPADQTETPAPQAEQALSEPLKEEPLRAYDGLDVEEPQTTVETDPVDEAIEETIESALTDTEGMSQEKKGQLEEATVPQEFLERLILISDERGREQLAGRMAAQELKEHPERLARVQDPVERWRQVRSAILERVQR